MAGGYAEPRQPGCARQEIPPGDWEFLALDFFCRLAVETDFALRYRKHNYEHEPYVPRRAVFSWLLFARADRKAGKIQIGKIRDETKLRRWLVLCDDRQGG